MKVKINVGQGEKKEGGRKEEGGRKAGLQGRIIPMLFAVCLATALMLQYPVSQTMFPSVRPTVCETKDKVDASLTKAPRPCQSCSH